MAKRRQKRNGNRGKKSRAGQGKARDFVLTSAVNLLIQVAALASVITDVLGH